MKAKCRREYWSTSENLRGKMELAMDVDTFKKKKKKKETVPNPYLVDRARLLVVGYLGHLVDLLQEKKKMTECRGEYWSTPAGGKEKGNRLPRPRAGEGRRRELGGAREWRRHGDRERERKREKEKGKEEKRRDRPGAPSPRPPAEKDPLGRARGRDPRAARPTVGAPAGRTDHRDTSPVHTPAWPRPGGWGKRSAASAERGRAEPRAPLGGRKSGRGHAVVGRRRKDTYAVAGEAFPHTPPDARARAGAGGCGRASGARPHPRETNPCVEG